MTVPTSDEVAGLTEPRTLAEWSEEHGDVVWWCWDKGIGDWLGEPAYIGTPLDCGHTIEIEFRSNRGEFIHQHQVGGWPGYHTHWTPHPARPPALQKASKPLTGEAARKAIFDPKYDNVVD